MERPNEHTGRGKATKPFSHKATLKGHPKTHAAQKNAVAHKHAAGPKGGEKKEGKAVAGESAVKFSQKQLEQTGALKIYEVLEHPLVSEKTVNMIGSENKLTFVVNGKATKTDVRKAVETMYNVKVDKVNICRDMKARKKAFVKLNKAFKADELATKLGVL